MLTAKDFDPSQPRAPKGSDEGGQWVTSGNPFWDQPRRDGRPTVRQERDAAEPGAPIIQANKWPGPDRQPAIVDRYARLVDEWERGQSLTSDELGAWHEAMRDHVDQGEVSVAVVNRAFEATAPLARPLYVYRGLRGDHAAEVAKLPVGAIYTPGALASASLSSSVAENFSSGGRGEQRDRTVLAIRIPPGGKVLPVTVHEAMVGRGEDAGDLEVLIPDASYRVVSHRRAYMPGHLYKVTTFTRLELILPGNRLHARRLAKTFDPSQPREPKGSEDGGQWSSPKSAKMVDVESRLGPSEPMHTWTSDSGDQTHRSTTATYTDPKGDQWRVEFFERTDKGHPVTLRSLVATAVGRADAADLRAWPNRGLDKWEIAGVQTGSRYRRRGLATAALAMLRRHATMPVVHSNSLTENGRAYAETVKDFDPNQPRAPKGSENGGEWVDAGTQYEQEGRRAMERIQAKIAEERRVLAEQREMLHSRPADEAFEGDDAALELNGLYATPAADAVKADLGVFSTLGAYQRTDNFAQINADARLGDANGNEVADLDRGMAMAPALERSVILYRGLNGHDRRLDELKGLPPEERFKAIQDLWRGQIGRTVVDGGFLSTSVDSDTAKRFANDVIFEITAPPGTRGLWLPGFGRDRVVDEDGYATDMVEREFLLSRHTRLQVTGISSREGYGYERKVLTVVKLRAFNAPGVFTKGFNPNQPRDPAGTPTGGQWAEGWDGGAAGAAMALMRATADVAPHLRDEMEVGVTTIDRFEELIASEPIETLGFFDKDGKLLAAKTGNEDSVEWDGPLPDGAVAATHNHPSGTPGFSIDDIAFSAHKGLDSITSVTVRPVFDADSAVTWVRSRYTMSGIREAVRQADGSRAFSLAWQRSVKVAVDNYTPRYHSLLVQVRASGNESLEYVAGRVTQHEQFKYEAELADRLGARMEWRDIGPGKPSAPATQYLRALSLKRTTDRMAKARGGISDREFETINPYTGKPFGASVAKDWDESKHPRHPAGSEQGGEFAGGDALPAAVSAEIARATEDLIGWTDRRERGILIDLNTGERLADNIGTAYSTDPKDFLQPDNNASVYLPYGDYPDRQIMVIHSHPESDDGLSGPDMSIARSGTVRRMVAVSDNYVYTVTRPADWDWQGKFTPRYINEKYDAILEEEYVGPPGFFPNITMVEAVHRTITRMSAELGYTYTRTPHRGRGTAEGYKTAVLKFVDDQPRAPKGSAIGGQWVDTTVPLDGVAAAERKSIGVLHQDSKPHRPLTRAELEALDAYQGGSYNTLNQAARREAGEGTDPSSGDSLARLGHEYAMRPVNTIHALASEAPPLTEPIVVFRGNGRAGAVFGVPWVTEPGGIHVSAIDDDGNDIVDPRTKPYTDAVAAEWKKRVGSIVRENGFLSTSADQKFVKQWVGRRRVDGLPSTYYEITLPKGTRGIYMPNFSGARGFDAEREFLLPPGSRLRVDRVLPPTKTRHGFLVKMTLVGQVHYTPPAPIAPSGGSRFDAVMGSPPLSKFVDDQPRAPKGVPTGGQWVDAHTLAAQGILAGIEFPMNTDVTPEQMNAVLVYQDDQGYTRMNDLMRQNAGEVTDFADDDGYREELADYVEPTMALIGLIDATPPLPQNTTLWRATQNGEKALGLKFGMDANQYTARRAAVAAAWEAKIGKVVRENAFTSTSTDRTFPDKYIKRPGGPDNPVMFRIRAPAGTRGVYTPYHTDYRKEEKEFLLPPGTAYRVDSVENSRDARMLVVTLTIVKQVVRGRNKIIKDFDPSQPRAPKGTAIGGRWIAQGHVGLVNENGTIGEFEDDPEEPVRGWARPGGVTEADPLDPEAPDGALRGAAAREALDIQFRAWDRQLGMLPLTDDVSPELRRDRRDEEAGQAWLNPFRWYMSDGNRTLNSLLRDGEQLPTPPTALRVRSDAELRFIAADMDSRIAAMPPLETPFRMYRTINNTEAALFGRGKGAGTSGNYRADPDVIVSEWRAAVGKIITDRGFGSATTERSQAERWGERATRFSTPTLVRLNILPGVRGAWMDQIVHHTETYFVKHEFLFPTGTRYRVTGVRAGRSDGDAGPGRPVMVTMDVLPPLKRS